MKKKILICILVAAPFCLPVSGQGGASLPMLEFNADARSAGMGESTMGEAKGMYLYTNPTSFLYSGSKIYGTYTYGLFPSTNDQGRLHFNGVSTGYRLKKQAIMVGFRSWQGLKSYKMGDDGAQGKKMEPVDIVIDMAYTREITNHLSAFIGGNYIYSDLGVGKKAHTGSASAGLFYRNYLKPCREEWAYTIGAAVRNLGGEVKYEKNSYDLPSSLDIGGSMAVPVAPGHIVNTTLTTHYQMLPSDDKAWSGGFGAEYELLELVDIRAGYHFGGSKHYATFGLGGKIKMVNLDASFHTGGSDMLGSKWRFGIGVHF